MSTILSCQNLSKYYGSTPALVDINLDVPSGKIVGLLGPNGSGKTTLIKLASGILTPSGGRLLIGDETPGPSTKSIVSYLPERSYLSDWMTMEDIVRLFADFYPDFNAHKANEMLLRLEINPRLRIKTLSKGTKEKVQLILVMSRESRLYLLDEPIGGVDPAAREYILNTIIGNYREDATVIISTHLISDVEKVLDEFIFINKGRIAMQAAVDDIRENQGKSVDALFREVYKC